MVERLVMPWALGTREAVTELIAEQQVPESLTGERFVLLCRDMRACSATSADEIVRVIIEERDAGELVLVGARERVVEQFRKSAWRRGVYFRCAVRSAAEVGV